MLDYDRAVETCAKHFADVLKSAGTGEVKPFVGSGFGGPILVGPGSPPTSSQVRQAPSAWVNTARVELIVHEALRSAARTMRKNGEGLPQPVENWLISLALEEIEPPKGPKRTVTDIVQGLVYHSIAALVIQMDVSPMRNPELGKKSTRDEKRSASDIVAAAFYSVRKEMQQQLPTSYDRVRKIWQEAGRLCPYNRADYQRFAADYPSGIWTLLEAAASK